VRRTQDYPSRQPLNSPEKESRPTGTVPLVTLNESFVLVWAAVSGQHLHRQSSANQQLDEQHYDSGNKQQMNETYYVKEETQHPED
jgi:hypothetical protein